MSPSSSSSSMESDCLVEIQSSLRLRPLTKRERDDQVILEPRPPSTRFKEPPTAVLLPYHKNLSSQDVTSGRFHADSDATASSVPREYHFSQILSTESTQEKTYHTIGLPTVTRIMDSLKRPSKSGPITELLVAIGVAGSGKSHTCFGGYPIPKRKTPQDGLVTRIIDGLLSQSKHLSGGSLRNFAIGITAVQIVHGKGGDARACQIQDLLATSKLNANKTSEPSPSNSKKSPPKKRLASVRSMVASFERTVLPSPILSPIRSSTSDVVEVDVEDPELTTAKCKDGAHARETIQAALLASRRASKGYQSSHILVTLEPYVNGKPSDVKVAVLDMAGIEKGKRNNNRGKDTVTTGNQAANAAVLHCLRTLQHNTNLYCGNEDALDIECVDDAASEISCVSQEKDQFKRKVKTVPFRQHKLTMMLSHLFLSGGAANVMLMMAAYPGHHDFFEKKLLLQDLELLCGSALLKKPSVASTGLDDEGEASLQSTDTGSFDYSSASSYDHDDLSEITDSAPMTKGDPPVKPVSILKPVVLAAKSFTATKPVIVAKPISRSKSLHVQPPSIAKKVVLTGGKVTLPPAFAPSFQAPMAKPTAPPLAPEIVEPAKPIEPIAPPPPAHNPGFVSDFPGVIMPSKDNSAAEPKNSTKSREVEPVEPKSFKPRAPAIIASAMVGGPNCRAPPSPISEVEEERTSFAKENKPAIIPSIRTGGPHARQPPSPQAHARNFRKDGTTSRAFDEPKHYSVDEPRSKQLHEQERHRNTPQEPHLSERDSTRYKTTEKSKERDRKKKNQMSSSERRRLQSLEAMVKELKAQKSELASKCEKLEKENLRLRKSTTQLEQALKAPRDGDDQFETKRQQRLKEQDLVKSPLWEHVQSVNNTYAIKNQWCMTQKPHFALRVPGQFERAPALDDRDARAASLPELPQASVVIGKGGNLGIGRAHPKASMV